ncbi:hypothetical protein XA68_10478 [Ophiocordyceps unilateralis]|uniref:Uncharacterized protein n=1 Tax=Ophiocordyceps unilateralis TaxID=268505 RepID=A0A2A9PIH5_OPHUN|nr:hypothetical protein XA68_10478 [Ophiocordyceps unilateralis]
MGVTTRQRLTRLHELELKHHDNLHKTESIYRDEEARLLKVQLLASRDDVAALQEDVERKDAALVALAAKHDSLRAKVEAGREAARVRDARLKKQDMELANLRAEVRSLNEAAEDAGKTLEDKFALGRELDRLRPEMRHLQTQLAGYQAMVEERNDLRRQLDSLEVELDNERRSRQRAETKEDACKTRLEKVDKTQAAEVRERDQLKRELAEARALGDRLEERIASLKTKYKTAQGELKETRTRLQTSEAELERVRKTAAAGVVANQGVAMGRKHRAQEANGIHTPGSKAGKRPVAGKKRGVELTAAVGEKSTFSITPFLRRTKDLTDETAVIEEEGEEKEEKEERDEEEEEEEEEEEDDSLAREEEESRPKTTDSKSKNKGLSAAQANKAFAKADSTQQDETIRLTTTTGQDKENAEARKKKKRKLAGQTTVLGDDDKEEATSTEAMVKKKKKTAMVLAKKPRLGAAGALVAGAAFSPLKRDRRGANASFLGGS